MKNNKIPNIYDENNNTVQKNAPEIVFNPDTEQQTITLTDAINNFLDTVFCISSITLFKFKDLPQLDFDISEIKASVGTEYTNYCNIQKSLYEKYFNYQFLKYYLDIDYASKITTDRLNTDKSLQDYICSLSIDVIINIVMYCLTHERKQALNAQYALNSEITNNIRDLLYTDTKCGALDIKSLIEYLKLIKRYAVNSITNKIVNIDSGNEQNLTDFVKNNTDKATFDVIKVKYSEKNGITYEKARNQRSQKYVFNNEFSTFYKAYKDGFKFNPYNPCTKFRDIHEYFRNKDFYNRYKPPFTKIVPDTDFKHLDKIKWQFDVYQEMLKVVCGYDENYIKWLNDYIAQLVQRPYERMPYVPILYSAVKQVGKSYIVSVMLPNLLKYTTSITSNFENVHGRFNSVIQKSVFQYKNEITIFDNGKNELVANKEKIKELSASETAYVADKNVKGEQEVRVYMHYAITTNNLNAIPIERDEQRFVVIRGLTDGSYCKNDKGIKYKNYKEYKELLNKFEMNLKTLPNFASEFYQYCFNFYTQRQIDVDFAHMYYKFDFILKTNQELRNEIYTCYADVVRDALETMHNDLIVDDKISLPTKLKNDLNSILKEIDNRTYNNQNIQFYFNKITNSYYSAKEFNVLWVYIRYLLESNPSLYDNDEFNTSYIKRGEATQDARMLGRYLKEFSECYPEVLKLKTKTKNNASKKSKKQTFNTYMLNPKYAELLDL